MTKPVLDLDELRILLRAVTIYRDTRKKHLDSIREKRLASGHPQEGNLKRLSQIAGTRDKLAQIIDYDSYKQRQPRGEVSDD